MCLDDSELNRADVSASASIIRILLRNVEIHLRSVELHLRDVELSAQSSYNEGRDLTHHCSRHQSLTPRTVMAMKEGTSLGELERAIMDLLWDATEPQTANQVRDTLAERQDSTPAITTVLTVLGRLHKKGFVVKDDARRPHEFSAATSREEHTAQLLNEVLGSAVDKRAVLARFIGGIDASDARTLQHLLSSRND